MPPEGLAAYDHKQIAMLEEPCIVVNHKDEALCSESKHNCHLSSVATSRQLLHRAFSVFLFDKQNRLLMQQRAADKITFPLYWTNTCCSHPLYTDEEMDQATNDDIAIGAKRAAIRKLEHELGVGADEIPIEDFRFLTRIHYAAESDSLWSEHEIDYILFIRPPRAVTLRVNANEVADFKYVTLLELQDMVVASKEGKIRLSPWIEIIIMQFLYRWWKDLDHIVAGDDVYTSFVDAQIHFANAHQGYGCDNLQ